MLWLHSRSGFKGGGGEYAISELKDHIPIICYIDIILNSYPQCHARTSTLINFVRVDIISSYYILIIVVSRKVFNEWSILLLSFMASGYILL